MQEFYNLADSAVLGHFGGGYALASIGQSGMAFNILINFFVGFSSGLSVITSRLFGAYQYDKLRRMINTAVSVAILFGIAMTVFIYFFAPVFFRLLGSPAEIIPTAMIYLRICVFGLTAQMLYNVGTSILRSLGDTRTPMLLFLLSGLTNLLLDLLLVAGFRLGVAGAAAATIASQWMLAVMILVRLLRLDPAYRITPLHPQFSLPDLMEAPSPATRYSACCGARR